MSESAHANPLQAGIPATLVPQPSVLIIFGGSGDLSQRKLLPALYNLRLDGVLPTNFAVVGIGRREMDDESFRGFAREGIEKFSRRGLDPEHWGDFERSLFFHRGSLDEPDMYRGLRKRLDEIDAEFGIPGNRVFYLSIPPGLFRTGVEQLAAAGLVSQPEEQGAPFTRIIVEKPIGHDLASARQVNSTLSEVFDESQLFRIDHYLGKETVQNLLVLRFGNAVFEPLWNQKYIDHVQITVAEEVGVGTRAGYYDGAGALRDMVQNHILQLLSLTAMEPPWSMNADVVRNNKLEVLQCLRPVGDDVEASAVRAQYGPGFHRGEAAPGYLQEQDVAEGSATETYVALKVFVDNWRWAGVPFYIRTGKRLPKRASEIAVRFKDVPHMLFNVDPQKPVEANVLVMRIQPDEGMSLRISTKLPGPRVQVYPTRMDFQYGSTFGDQSPEAYERLLLDVMAGDATLFMRRDEVEASWSWITPILEAWQARKPQALPRYEAGTWGPAEADELIATTGGRWRTL